ncbi:helix-turn-helix domain-containing protein [Duganella sp. FT92W]|uniref:Helix-turn-helix domain-containing protein n=1 Tax=Pseudoduganella rivuli TaxID=2666085 RepID=A0A7X2LR15_9BURK|nr:AraC family transcriptional regulator [Pseudoduganella rivuli]MRV71955.1 helix-turn-helix domain-containing protein [Pseudoduganella rivuli]
MSPNQRRRQDDVADKPAAVANIIPNMARALLGLIEDRGLSPARLCRGMGFTYQDLLRHQVLLSYQQTRELILRAQRLLQDPAFGVAVGARQTPVSWGVAGLAMLTCETFGEATQYVVAQQEAAGALVENFVEVRGNELMLEVRPRRFDLQIEGFLADESLAGALAISRYLLGAELRPLRIDFTRSAPAHDEMYRRYFRCPLRFNADVNRMVLESHWLDVRLPGYDRITCSMVREQLNSLLHVPPGRDDLQESVANQMRFRTGQAPSQVHIAQAVNVSARSLRRQLSSQGASYRALRDATRFEAARDLLAHSQLSVAAIAERMGYADARSFRRAFKRWSGVLPSDYRDRLPEAEH